MLHHSSTHQWHNIPVSAHSGSPPQCFTFSSFQLCLGTRRLPCLYHWLLRWRRAGLGWAGYNLLISNSIYMFISCFLWLVKLCSDWGWRVKGSSFTRPSTDHTKPLILLGVGGETNHQFNLGNGNSGWGNELLKLASTTESNIEPCGLL